MDAQDQRWWLVDAITIDINPDDPHCSRCGETLLPVPRQWRHNSIPQNETRVPINELGDKITPPPEPRTLDAHRQWTDEDRPPAPPDPPSPGRKLYRFCMLIATPLLVFALLYLLGGILVLLIGSNEVTRGQALLVIAVAILAGFVALMLAGTGATIDDLRHARLYRRWDKEVAGPAIAELEHWKTRAWQNYLSQKETWRGRWICDGCQAVFRSRETRRC